MAIRFDEGYLTIQDIYDGSNATYQSIDYNGNPTVLIKGPNGGDWNYTVVSAGAVTTKDPYQIITISFLVNGEAIWKGNVVWSLYGSTPVQQNDPNAKIEVGDGVSSVVVGSPSDVTLTITDDETITPVVTLVHKASKVSAIIAFTVVIGGDEGQTGATGEQGETGATGGRGAGKYNYYNSTSTKPSTSNQAQLNTYFTSASGYDDPVKNDTLTVVSESINDVSSFIYDGSSWQKASQQIDGSLVVTETIASDALVANTIEGGKISSSTTITAGSGNNVAAINGDDSGNKDGYRIWAGNSVPADAPFSVDKEGNLLANKGTFGGTVACDVFSAGKQFTLAANNTIGEARWEMITPGLGVLGDTNIAYNVACNVGNVVTSPYLCSSPYWIYTDLCNRSSMYAPDATVSVNNNIQVQTTDGGNRVMYTNYPKMTSRTDSVTGKYKRFRIEISGSYILHDLYYTGSLAGGYSRPFIAGICIRARHYTSSGALAHTDYLQGPEDATMTLGGGAYYSSSNAPGAAGGSSRLVYNLRGYAQLQVPYTPMYRSPNSGISGGEAVNTNFVFDLSHRDTNTLMANIATYNTWYLHLDYYFMWYGTVQSGSAVANLYFTQASTMKISYSNV